MLDMRSPKPKYTHTWEVLLVTKYLDCLGKTKLLPLKFLSIKLAILFALSYPEQAFPRKRGSSDELPQPLFFLTTFQHRDRLVGTLRHYLWATLKELQFFSIKTRSFVLFFCSYVKRHNPVTAPTHSRRLHVALKNAGIDTNIFKVHSDRGASTTAAANSNVPLDDVRKMADSYLVSNFPKF